MEQIKMADGVHLQVEKTEQFTTTQISINFATPKVNADLAGRFLASNFLETVSKKYPTQQKFAQVLNELYGAGFSVEVSNMGGVHNFCINLEIVDPKLLNSSEDLLTAAFSFLETILFEPLGNEIEGFEPTIFQRQKEIALDEIAGLNDDREYQIIRTTIENSFVNGNLGLAAYGNQELVEQSTNLSVWRTYQKLLVADQIDVVVVGPVDVSQIKQLMHQYLPFQARTIQLPVKQQPGFQPPKIQYLNEPVLQAQIVLSWQLTLDWSERFSGYVLNALLGGNGLSRLFLHVREEAGLAYTIYSDFNFYTDLMFVVAGVRVDQVNAARKMILDEVHDLQDNQITEAELKQIKQLMLNDYRLGQDQIRTRTERGLSRAITKKVLTPIEWQACLEKVTKKDVQAVAQRLQLKIQMILQRREDKNE
ncbi:EF-P 5-aminopentanol modification-associated protein YfmF [Weissella coleopterorum]|nr:pitrilysin family protein [Weissella coleopterorum]